MSKFTILLILVINIITSTKLVKPKDKAQSGEELLNMMKFLPNQDKNNTNITDTSDYDSYVFSFQWGKTFCISKGDTKNCEDKLKHAKENHFTLHGLWPGLKSGARIPDCSGHAKIEPDGSALFETMSHEWASFTDANEKFWDHEYNKHGYCYSIKTKSENNYKKFFQQTLDIFHSKPYADLYLGIEKQSKHNYNFDKLHEEFEKVIGKGFQLQCVNHAGIQLLSEIHIYMDLDFVVDPNPKFTGNFCSKTKDIFIFPFDYVPQKESVQEITKAES